MPASLRPVQYVGDGKSQRAPAREAGAQNPDAVEAAVHAILDRRYAGGYDAALLRLGIVDVFRAYRGEYPGLLRCDCPYHDLRHSLETALSMARLLDGYALSQAPRVAAGIDADHALLCIVLALFHDVGLLRREHEAHLHGPSLMPVHEERGVEFLRAYLAGTTLRELRGEAELIMATKPSYKFPDGWSTLRRLLASMIATADLISQISDRCYLEKCRDLLYLEFSACGWAGKPDSIYPDSRSLLEKTPAFVEGFLRKRMDEEFQGVRQYLRVHMAGVDPWELAVQRNVAHLKKLLKSGNLDQLRRNSVS